MFWVKFSMGLLSSGPGHLGVLSTIFFEWHHSVELAHILSE